MEGLAGWFKSRYPLLANIAIGEEGQGEVAAMSPLIGVINAVAEAERGSFCFVLPRKGDFGRIASIAIALTALRREYAALAAASQAPVKPGEHVRVHPGKRVFRFAGDASEFPEHFWLECKDGSRRTFPRSQAFRLERATVQKMTGRGGDPLISVPKHAIDLLLGIESYGNLSNIPTSVFLLDVQARFREFADHITVGRLAGTQGASSSMAQLEIVGHVEDDGTLRELNGQHGFPMIAVTSSVEAIINAVNRAARVPTVVVNSLALLRSPQHFDILADKARVLAIADHGEYERVSELRARGCKVWPIGSAELLAGYADGDPLPDGPLGEIAHAAQNADAEVESVEVPGGLLDSASLELQELGSALTGNEEQRRQLVAPLYGLLMRMAAVVGERTTAEAAEWITSVNAVRAELARLRHWIAKEDVGRLEKACDGFEQAAGDASVGASKSIRLQEIFESLKRDDVGVVAVVARRGAAGNHVKRLATEAGLDVELFTGDPALIPDEFFGAVVFTSWIGSAKFKRVRQAYLAPRVFALGYPFESAWLGQSISGMRRERSGPVFTGAERARLIGISSDLPLAWTGTAASENVPTSERDASLLDIERTFSTMRRGSGVTQFDTEEKIQARYVEFAGGRFAFLSEGHVLPVATELVVNESSVPSKLPEKDVNEWLVGDYIVFLEGGGAQVIKAIADRMLGGRALQLRQTAMQWRNALISTGLSAGEIKRQLGLAGCVRTVATIRGWLSTSSRIGPELKSDLEAIALVTGVRALTTSIDLVWGAIQELWSAHLSAGTVLRRILVQKLPHLVEELEEAGTEIAIEDAGRHLGRALIVKVEQIADAFEPCSRSLVNRLRNESLDVVLDETPEQSALQNALASFDRHSEPERAELLKKLEEL